jgi:hypothetical protein
MAGAAPSSGATTAIMNLFIWIIIVVSVSSQEGGTHSLGLTRQAILRLLAMRGQQLKLKMVK